MLELSYNNLFFWRKWAGKTQMAVICAYNAYKEWKIIISNIWLSFPHIRFQWWNDLPPILKEIAWYCNDNVMAVEAPKQMLQEYWMQRKSMKLNNYFILFDEIGNHLNNRNWNKNFKEPLLRDMLTEPRKYKLTIVWICQAWQDVDVAFLRACEDWFLFSKKWSWKIFERMVFHHFWVIWGELKLDEEMYLIEKWQKFLYWWKMLAEFRKMYWTWEIVWAWRKFFAPHTFKKWDIYDVVEVWYKDENWDFHSIPLLETKSLSMNESEAGENKGVEGESPSHNFTTKKIAKRWRPRKNLQNKE